MSIIKTAIDIIARRRQDSARKTRTGHHAQAEPEHVFLCDGMGHPAKASSPNPVPGTCEEFPYFEFSCYHASGLCLNRSEGH
jgi:hypothetical protein